MHPFAIVALFLILARTITELCLNRLNQRHVHANANEVPQAFREIIDEPTYRRSVDYTLAKSRFGEIAGAFDFLLLIAVLFSGVLPWAFGKFTANFGTSVWAMASFLLVTGIALSVLALPFAWYAQFKLEERFGFNTTTMKTWAVDRVKGFLLALLLGYPLLALVLKLIEWTGANWWLWAAAVVIAFQLLLLLIAPAIIMPLFNKFTPLPEGALRGRLFGLAQRTNFPTRSIDVMDGSKRSRHSNAFFTGFGRFRKIVLGFEYEGDFLAVDVVPAMLLFALLAGTITFWLSPLLHMWSRRFEYEADAFAHVTTGEAQPLIQALRKLSEKNLTNLTPHPIYSAFYYSHPTLLERERALRTAT